MYPVRPGWRWVDVGLWFCGRWEVEDSQLSSIEVTKRVVDGTMQNMMHFLVFTMETLVDFVDGWLPTLDT